MKQPVCFSTGNFYVKGKKRDLDKEISNSLKLDVEGIELLDGTVTSFMKFRLSKSNKKKLKKLKYNTIHVPFRWKDNSKRHFIVYNTKECRKVLDRLEKLYKEIGAININFHYYQLKNIKVLDDYDFNYSVENLEKHHHIKLKSYKDMLNKNKNLPFLFDVSHAMECGNFDKLLNSVKDRIKYVHIHIMHNGELHRLLHLVDNKTLSKISKLKKLNVVFIIEGGIEEEGNMKIFKDEIKFVRKWLNS